MNKLYCNTLKISLFAFCFAVILSGCQPGMPGLPGGASLPMRKKMPELSSDGDNFEGTPAFQQHSLGPTQGNASFNAQDVDLAISGISQGFISFSLPDASADSATVKLLENLKPFAMVLLSNWAQQQRHGVAIDLSAHNGETIHRTDFILEQPHGFSFPLVVVWDRFSANRLSTIKQLIGEVPSLKLNEIASN